MEKKDKKIYITLKDGTKKEYDVLFTFTNDDNHKDYIVYTDNSYNENNKLRVFAAVYNPYTYEFIEVPESKEEWDMIYKMMDKIIKNESME